MPDDKTPETQIPTFATGEYRQTNGWATMRPFMREDGHDVWASDLLKIDKEPTPPITKNAPLG